MKDKLFKYGIFGVSTIAALVAGFIFLNNLSCVSFGPEIKGLPEECQYSLKQTFLAIQANKNPVSQIVAEESSRACLAKFRDKTCSKRFLDYMEEHKADMMDTSSPYKAQFFQTQAQLIINQCQKDLKP